MPSARCREIRARLDAYVEHELSADAAAAVRAHLDGCPVCRTEETRIVRALLPLRAWTPGQAPSDLAAGLHARIAAMQAPHRRNVWRLQIAGAAASVLLVAVCIATGLRHNSPGMSASDDAPVGRALRSGTETTPRAAANIPAPGSSIAPSSELKALRAPGATLAPAPGTVPTPATADARPPRTARTRPTPAPRSFLDVADSRGVTARALMSGVARRPEANPDASNVTQPLPATVVRRTAPQPPPRFEQTLNERVRVGDQVTELYGEAKWDESGRLRAIRVRAETADADGAGAE